MKKKMAIYGGVSIAIGIILLIANQYISAFAMQQALDEINPETFEEIIGGIFSGAILSLTVYRVIAILSIVLIALGILIIIIGLILKEKDSKSFKRKKMPAKTVTAKYTRSSRQKKAKFASFFVTAWGSKIGNSKSKKLRLRKTRNIKKYQAWNKQ